MTEKIGVEAFFDTADFNRGVKQYNNGLTKANKETSKTTKSVSKGFGDIGTALAKLGVGFSMAAVLNEVRKFAQESIQEFRAFETSFAEVMTLLPDLTSDAANSMRDDILNFSTDVGRVTDETVPALYQAISAGVPPENAFDFLRIASDAALGGVTTLETAVDGITSVMNAYGEEVVGAAEASDLMFTAVRLGKTNFEQLSKSLFNVVPIAAALGVEFGDVTAALAAMTAQGVPTSVATTQLRQLFVELSKAGGKASTTFEEMAGVTFREFIAQGNNVSDALTIMEGAAADTGVGVNDLFSSVEAGNAALALTGDGAASFNEALEAMEASAGATAEAAETMADSLEFAEGKAKAAKEKFQILAAEGLVPAKKRFAELQTVMFEFGSEQVRLDTQVNKLAESLRLQGMSFQETKNIIAQARLAVQEYADGSMVPAIEVTERMDAATRLLTSGFEGTEAQLRSSIEAIIANEERAELMGEAYRVMYGITEEGIVTTQEATTAQTEFGLAILESLEPTHNYGREIDILSESEFELAMATVEARESSQLLLETVREGRVAAEEAAIAAEALAAAERELALATSEYFAEALRATGETTNFNLTLFDAAVSAGVDATALGILALATGEFTQAEIDAALKTALMKVRIDELVVAITQETLTAEEAVVALQLLEDGTATTTESAILLAQSADNVNTALLGTTASSTDAADAIGGIPGTAGEAGASLDEVASKAGAAADALNAIPTDIDISVTTIFTQEGGPPPGAGSGIPEFADGGFTGPGSGVAGIVHGNEFVFNAKSVRTLGVGFLDAMQVAASRHSGMSPVAGGGSQFMQPPVVNVDGGNVTKNFNMKMQTTQSPSGVRRGFRLMQMVEST